MKNNKKSTNEFKKTENTPNESVEMPSVESSLEENVNPSKEAFQVGEKQSDSVNTNTTSENDGAKLDGSMDEKSNLESETNLVSEKNDNQIENNDTRIENVGNDEIGENADNTTREVSSVNSGERLDSTGVMSDNTPQNDTEIKEGEEGLNNQLLNEEGSIGEQNLADGQSQPGVENSIGEQSIADTQSQIAENPIDGQSRANESVMGGQTEEAEQNPTNLGSPIGTQSFGENNTPQLGLNMQNAGVGSVENVNGNVQNFGVINPGNENNNLQSAGERNFDGVNGNFQSEIPQNAGAGSLENVNAQGIENINQAENLSEVKEESPKKSKFSFPKKMGVVTGKTASLSDIAKLEDEATKSVKNKGKVEEPENLNQELDEAGEEEIEEEVVEEEVLDEEVGDEIVDEEIVEEEVEEEVEEVVDENLSTNEGAVADENVENAEAQRIENGLPNTGTASAIGGESNARENVAGETQKGKIPEFIPTEKISNISSSQTGVSEAFVESEESAMKRIEEDEKRKSKFVMFPKKSDGTGAVNGAGFNKDNIKDGSRSLRFREASPEQTEADIKNDIKKPKPLWLKITIAVAVAVISVGAIFGAYLGYLQGGHDRVYDWKMLQVVGKNKSNRVSLNTQLDIITYNLSYGIMDPEFTYFKAENKMPNGSTTKGSSSRATNKDRVSINVNGSAELVGKGSNASTDFILFQDIDVDSTRSYYINQKEILTNVLSNFAGVFAENGSSNYVFSPISSPLGKIDTRMATFSNKYMSLKIRYSLPSNSEFLGKYGSNDNCVIVTTYKTAGAKELSVVNVNVGIYESAEVRLADLEAILQIMDYEANTRGNYVVVGGSFGYLLNGEEGEFLNTSGSPSWSECLPESFSADSLKQIGFRIVKDEIALDQKIGTVRDMSEKYNKGVSFEAVIDGFIVSNDVAIDSVSVIDNGFLYSSHNPVKMSFRLI